MLKIAYYLDYVKLKPLCDAAAAAADDDDDDADDDHCV